MGPKITIDSASLANKGLEVIEAACFFNISPDKIKVVIHPQSVVHSMIRLRDGMVYAQLSRPDMRYPIHAALYWPDIKPAGFGRLDFDSLTLEFEKPDTEKFPMLAYAYEAARRGGLYPCAYNAANEIAVAAFLERRIAFPGIPRIVDSVLKNDWSGEAGEPDLVLETDAKAREFALSSINSL
jgi:1-deoxy-D-xylulose-5-phosphate reductoisomerase